MKGHQKNIKNNLRDSEDSLDAFLSRAEAENETEQEEPEKGCEHPRWPRIFMVIAIVAIGLYAWKHVQPTLNVISPASVISLNQPGEDLLNRMNTRMAEMGYSGLEHDDLRELRSHGVTATYISNVRALGYEELSLDDAVRLARANVSSAFTAMMQELGYEASVDDLIRLRDAGVTAHFTSNLHDLGYRDVTFDQLIRLQRIGVTTSLVERMQEERGEDISLDEIIRYRISNQ
jgi:hypothetical protein